MNDKEQEEIFNKNIIDYHADMGIKEDARLYLQVLALKNAGKTSEAKTLISDTLEKDAANKNIQWVKAKENGNSSVNDLTHELLKSAENRPLDNSFLLLNEFLDIISK